MKTHGKKKIHIRRMKTAQNINKRCAGYMIFVKDEWRMCVRLCEYIRAFNFDEWPHIFYIVCCVICWNQRNIYSQMRIAMHGQRESCMPDWMQALHRRLHTTYRWMCIYLFGRKCSRMHNHWCITVQLNYVFQWEIEFASLCCLYSIAVRLFLSQSFKFNKIINWNRA